MAQILRILSTYRVLLWNGTKITLLISVMTIILGLICGTLMAFMRISKSPVLRSIAAAYVEFIRDTPVLVQIFIVYYGLPMIGIEIPSIMFGGVDISRLLSGTVALSVNSTAYICEIVRSGIQSIDIGQTEGAMALGLNGRRRMWYVILPQAIKNIIPALANEFVTVIKTSSQVSVIGIAELMYAADTIRGISFRPMEPLLIVAVIYFIITFSLSCVIRRIEKNMRRSSRS